MKIHLVILLLCSMAILGLSACNGGSSGSSIFPTNVFASLFSQPSATSGSGNVNPGDAGTVDPTANPNNL